MAKARLVVGIDLGTTHTVVAWAPGSGATAPRVFDVPQLLTATESAARPLLPSSLYAVPEGERAEDPWGDAPWVVGEHARRRGVEVPSRLVASAKSWLCHPRVDRTAPILPWGAADDAPDLPRLSPVDASARVLGHVKRAWNAAHPDAPLEEQDLVLTVPASFDDAARELTLQAARTAGLAVRLLEEPQAAFYDFMSHADAGAAGALIDRAGGEALVLVCDTGGGTTDLSLVKLTRGRGKRPFTAHRVAVGHHLLLGGDNMDLALAHLLESRLVTPPARLEPARFAQLVQACRGAKERLLGDDPPEDVAVALLGAGSRLVGGTLTARLARDEAQRIVLDGFLPIVARDARPDRARSALVAFGLPYEREAAITKHVASFFSRHASEVGPHALLLNGGIFRAKGIRDRIVAAVEAWGGPPLELLPGTDPDLAVARGAVRHGLALRGRGMRIEAGAARGYYLGLDAKPDEPRPLVCVVPRGAKEGARHAAEGKAFALLVGRPVRFDLFASDEAKDPAGALVSFDADRFERLPPAFVAFDAADAGEARAELKVALEGEISSVGTLDLACVELDAQGAAGSEPGRKRFRVAFDLRAEEGEAPKSSMPPSLGKALGVSVRALAQERRDAEGAHHAAAGDAITRVFGKGRSDVSPRQVKDLVRDLEKILGERASWTTAVARALFDVLLTEARGRKRSPDHERVFWLLAGFCVRPGFGDPHDPARVRELAGLFEEKLAFAQEVRGWQQFWIAWRRAAAGLDDATQAHIRDVADPLLAPAEKRLKKPKGWKLEAESDLLDLAGALERVPAARRSELGGWILERTWTDRDPHLWTLIGRLGARVPAYASVHHVVSPLAAERWIDHLLREKWDPGQRERPEAAVQLARVTDDRARDVSEAARREVERRLVAFGAPEAWVRAVREAVPVREEEQRAFFGESLPVGLRLLD
jgi:molecular chaperone DnaK (HSP70)